MKQALILAAGRGARLDRRGTPKPLVEVGGHPIIFRLIEQLRDVGVSKVHVVIGYEKHRIRRAIAGRPWGEYMEIEFHENLQWQKGSGFSVLAARESLDEPFLPTHLCETEVVWTRSPPVHLAVVGPVLTHHQ